MILSELRRQVYNGIEVQMRSVSSEEDGYDVTIIVNSDGAMLLHENDLIFLYPDQIQDLKRSLDVL